MSAKTVRLLLVVTLGISALAACAGPPLNPLRPAGAKALLEDKDNGKTITLKKGQTVEVRLVSNRTTGYAWQVLSAPAAKIATKVSEAFEAPVQTFSGGVPNDGAAGAQLWNFRAEAPGETKVVLIYKRGGEPETADHRRFTFTLKVTDAADPPPPAAQELKLNAGDTGKTLTLTPGQLVTVQLGSNPSTGYSWSLLEAPNDAIVTKVGVTSQGPAVPMPGSGGTERWAFKAVAAGETHLVLVYKRGWEKLTKADERFALTVKVR